MEKEIILARIPMAIAVSHISEPEEGLYQSRRAYWSRATGAHSNRKSSITFDTEEKAIEFEREKAISWFSGIADRDDTSVKARSEAQEMVRRLKAA